MAVDVLTEIVIDRPASEVAAYAADPSNAPQWYANIKSVDWQTPPPIGVGSKLDFVAHFLGRRLAYTYEIVELTPGQLGRVPQSLAGSRRPASRPAALSSVDARTPVRLPPPPCRSGADAPLPDRRWIAGHGLVMRTAQGPFPMETTYTWTSLDAGRTRMTLRNRGAPAGFSKLTSPFMAAAMRRANNKDLANLKRILERAETG